MPTLTSYEEGEMISQRPFTNSRWHERYEDEGCWSSSSRSPMLKSFSGVFSAELSRVVPCSIELPLCLNLDGTPRSPLCHAPSLPLVSLLHHQVCQHHSQTNLVHAPHQAIETDCLSSPEVQSYHCGVPACMRNLNPLSLHASRPCIL